MNRSIVLLILAGGIVYVLAPAPKPIAEPPGTTGIDSSAPPQDAGLPAIEAPAPPGTPVEPTPDELAYIKGMGSLADYYVEEKAMSCGLPNNADYYRQVSSMANLRLAAEYHISPAYIKEWAKFVREGVRDAFTCEMLKNRRLGTDGHITFPPMGHLPSTTP